MGLRARKNHPIWKRSGNLIVLNPLYGGHASNDLESIPEPTTEILRFANSKKKKVRRQRTSHPQNVNGNEVNLLVVEDDPYDFAIVQRLLKKSRIYHFEIDNAVNLEAALEKLKKKPYKAILLDLALPDSFGIETLNQIKAKANDQAIIILTGDADIENSGEFIARGANDYLIKSELSSSLIEKSIMYSIERNEQLVREHQQKEKLKRAVRESKYYQEMQQLFLANISHDLRTPLGAIRGFTELLISDGSHVNVNEYLNIILRNTRTLQELVNDLLDISRIETKSLHIRSEKTNLLEQFNEIIATQRIFAQKKKLELNLIIKKPFPEMVNTDPLRLKQILSNVIGNAIKYTKEGYINVDAGLSVSDEEKGYLYVTVADTGPGIPLSAQKYLFRAFGQERKLHNHQRLSSGLGLVIARKLAQAMGGDIRLKSSIPKQGTKILITIEVGLVVEEEDQSAASQARGLTAPSPQSPRILLVEDNPDNQALFSLILKSAGLNFSIAANGLLAINMVAKEDFDLIFMDIQMPVMDGYQATRKLRKFGFSGPIIALTAHAMTEERRRCMRAGFDDFLAKPVPSEKLIEYIKKFTGSKAPPDDTPLRSSIDDQKDLLPLLARYSANLRKIIVDMANAIDAHNWDDLARIAHTLKGSAASYGFPAIQMQAERIEKEIHGERNPETFQDLIKTLRILQERTERTYTL